VTGKYYKVESTSLSHHGEAWDTELQIITAKGKDYGSRPKVCQSFVEGKCVSALWKFFKGI